MTRAKKKKSFEEWLEQVEEVVRELEDGKIPLARSLERYEEGIRALRNCQKLLAEAESRLEILEERGEGPAASAPEITIDGPELET